MIKLGWKVYPTQMYSTGIFPEADNDCRFTNYNMFVLQSRVYPFIYKMFSHMGPLSIGVVVDREKGEGLDKGMLSAYLKIAQIPADNNLGLKPDVPLALSTEEKKKIEEQIAKLDTYNKGWALIDAAELYKGLPLSPLRTPYPWGWMVSVLEYLDLSTSYDSFIAPEGIYLKFNPNSDYKRAYEEVSVFIKNKISEIYKRGGIVLGDQIDGKEKEKLIRDWKLVPQDTLMEIDGEARGVHRFFIPDWEDRRFAEDKVLFLLSRIQGDKYLRVEVPENYAKRHFIIKGMQSLGKPCVIEGNILKVQVENLEEARQVVSTVHGYQSLAKGKVLAISAKRLGDVLLYFQYAEKYQKGESLSYSVGDLENPYVFSCLLKDGDASSLETLRERFHSYAVERLADATKIAKLKLMSPYEIIEGEFS